MRNNVTQCPSPNYTKGKNRQITCVVLHATATTALASPKAWLCNPDSKVSAHYLIDLDGTIYGLVDEKDIAWHAGVSEWNGQSNMNSVSVGIELVNANDAKQAYSQSQIDACADLVTSICKDYLIAPQNVVGHKDIAPGRKTDPAGFPFDEFRLKLYDLGVPTNV